MLCMCIALPMTLALFMNNHICYSTCDSVQSIKCMVKSDDIQERDGSIFKPFVAHCCILGHGSMSDVTAGNIHGITEFDSLAMDFTCRKCLSHVDNNLAQKGKQLQCLHQNKPFLVWMLHYYAQEGPPGL